MTRVVICTLGLLVVGAGVTTAQRMRSVQDTKAVARFDVDPEESEKRCGHIEDRDVRTACRHEVYQRIVIFSDVWLAKHPNPEVCVSDEGSKMTCVPVTKLRELINNSRPR